VLGFGTGNLKDSTMEKLADKGNGNYAYIDGLSEARKVLVAEMGGTLMPVAKDVKIQVEFNPTQVQAWRLIGYENRLLAHEDFADDTKDAGEIGAGLAVTALYEIVPHGVPLPDSVAQDTVAPLRYQQPADVGGQAFSGELLFLKLRYKPVDADESTAVETPVRDGGGNWYEASDDFKLASGVALFGMLLRRSENAGQGAWPLVRQLVLESQGDDQRGYRAELLRMVDAAAGIRGKLGDALRMLGYGEDR
jgi:Ca-activated chloride channel family protein